LFYFSDEDGLPGASYVAGAFTKERKVTLLIVCSEFVKKSVNISGKKLGTTALVKRRA
jgi:hypothetical protein